MGGQAEGGRTQDGWPTGASSNDSGAAVPSECGRHAVTKTCAEAVMQQLMQGVRKIIEKLRRAGGSTPPLLHSSTGEMRVTRRLAVRKRVCQYEHATALQSSRGSTPPRLACATLRIGRRLALPASPIVHKLVQWGHPLQLASSTPSFAFRFIRFCASSAFALCPLHHHAPPTVSSSFPPPIPRSSLHSSHLPRHRPMSSRTVRSPCQVLLVLEQ